MKPNLTMQGFVAGVRQPTGEISRRFPGMNGMERARSFAQGARVGRVCGSVLRSPWFWGVLIAGTILFGYAAFQDHSLAHCTSDTVNQTLNCS